jgi:hypothetical protein
MSKDSVWRFSEALGLGADLGAKEDESSRESSISLELDKLASALGLFASCMC